MLIYPAEGNIHSLILLITCNLIPFFLNTSFTLYLWFFSIAAITWNWNCVWKHNFNTQVGQAGGNGTLMPVFFSHNICTFKFNPIQQLSKECIWWPTLFWVDKEWNSNNAIHGQNLKNLILATEWFYNKLWKMPRTKIR